MGNEWSDCTHHWIIEGPQGPTSRGRCKKCREQKEFDNHFNDNMRKINHWSWRNRQGSK